MVIPVIHDFVHEIVVTVIIAVGGSALMYPFRKIKQEFAEAKEALSAVHKELVAQRTNCLSTIQTTGAEQVKLLEKAVDVLEAMHLDQRELLGRLDK
jgi:hypothetical protein